MADAIAFAGVEEEDLVRLGDRIVSAKMSNVNAAIREHHVGGVRGFLIAVMPAAALALDISDGDDLRLQKRSGDHLGHATILASPWPPDCSLGPDTIMPGGMSICSGTS